MLKNFRLSKRGTNNAALASVLGALNDVAAAGAVTDADTQMQYVKQLVTLLLLVPTTAMRGTDNAALASVLGALNAATGSGAVSDAKVAMTYLKQLVTDLIALDTVCDAIPTTAMRGTDNVVLAGPTNTQMNTAIALCAQIADGWDAALATILDNFSAGRIGYLDNLSGGAVTAVGPTNTQMNTAHALLATVAKQNRVLCVMDFWSLSQEEVPLVIGAGDEGLPSVTVADLPGGATVVRAIAMFKFRAVENHTYAGANALDGAQVIQIATSVPAINFVDTQFTIAETTREGGDVVVGAIDIAGTVTGNAAYAFHWDLAKAQQTGLNFNDVQMGLRIWYSL